ncbi:MAG: hypothetical protein FWG98_14565 [Candidatus Cloacimonetes bacterium]|nr:hypothetical protein [Candidatus Cloacimonadota bacterium]
MLKTKEISGISLFLTQTVLNRQIFEQLRRSLKKTLFVLTALFYLITSLFSFPLPSLSIASDEITEHAYDIQGFIVINIFVVDDDETEDETNSETNNHQKCPKQHKKNTKKDKKDGFDRPIFDSVKKLADFPKETKQFFIFTENIKVFDLLKSYLWLLYLY